MLDAIALAARGVWKRYGTRTVLRDVNIVARSGELHGLLGPNGAGKTTLLRVLLGLVGRDAGDVHLFGSLHDSSSGVLPDGVAGFVETPSFYPYLSGRANLAVLSRLDDTPARARGTRIEAALEETGLAPHAKLAVSAYSAGMRQKLGIAAALLRAPRLLFLDEPTNALDPASARDIRALVKRLAREGAAVVWSSHDMDEVEELCATISVIDNGQMLFAGTVDDLRALAPADVHALRTSNNAAALDLAGRHRGLRVTATDDALHIAAEGPTLDAYIVALGCSGIAVRTLERRARSLESLFLDLTGRQEAKADAAAAIDPADAARVSATVS